jgi:hypothetical protein
MRGEHGEAAGARCPAQQADRLSGVLHLDADDAESGTESLMSTLIVPLNGSLTAHTPSAHLLRDRFAHFTGRPCAAAAGTFPRRTDFSQCRLRLMHRASPSRTLCTVTGNVRANVLHQKERTGLRQPDHAADAPASLGPCHSTATRACAGAMQHVCRWHGDLPPCGGHKIAGLPAQNLTNVYVSRYYAMYDYASVGLK